MRAAPFAESIAAALAPIVSDAGTTIIRGVLAAPPLHLSPEDRTRAVALLNTAVDCGVTALRDFDRRRYATAHDDIVEVLVSLRDLRDMLSPHPEAERPIGSEILQEWMR